MISNFIDRNRIWIMIGSILTVFFGALIWWNGQGQNNDLDTKIAEGNLNQSRYLALVAQKNALLKQRNDLTKIYIGPKNEIANLEASFVDDIAQTSRRHSVSFVGATYGQINGSNPPPPNPYVDRSGQPVGANGLLTTPNVTGQQGPAIVHDLGGRAPGDPKTEQPIIPPNLFTRIPVSVTLKGQWLNLAEALQDISRQDVLMSVSDPEVRRFNGQILTLSFTAQILMPAINTIDSPSNDNGTQTKARQQSALPLNENQNQKH